MFTRLIFLLLVLCFPSSIFSVGQARATTQYATSSELLSLQKELRRSRASWSAGRTSMSDLSRTEKQQILGASVTEVQTNGNYGQRTKLIHDALSEVFDWRDQNGKNFVTPVKNQGRCGSCVAFAAASVFETQMNITTNSIGLGWGFSPQHLFSCGGGSCTSGWFPVAAVDFLEDKGIPEEACFPYTSGAVGSDVSCKLTCRDSKMRSQKASMRARSRVFRGASIDDVKSALLGGPLITTMRVYDDFYHYTRGVYRHMKGPLLGGHAVMIVGWNNADEAWIVRNSWGTDWGEEGDFRIAWNDISGVGSSFYGLDAAESSDAVVLEGIRDRQTIKKPMTLKMHLHNVAATSAVLEVLGAGKSLVSKPFDSQGELIFNPSEFADGVYTIQVRARIAKTSIEERVSQARLVYVRTGTPSATIKIERMKPNMNVWDTIIPHFVVSSQPVPLSYIQYRILDARGQQVRWRRTEHTADRVAMSLNPKGLRSEKHVLIVEAISDEGNVLASDRLEFNVIER